MSGNQSRSHRLCSQPLKNKITKNKVITTRDLCPFEPTRMLTKFHHSYSQPSSSSSPPRPCRINNTLHSAATCVQWAGCETQKRERKPCSSQRGKQITRLEQQPNVKSDMRMSNCVLESQPQSKCFRRRCPHRYNEEASCTGGFFWVSYQQMKTANFLESVRRQNMTLPSLKMVAAGGHVQQSQGTPGDEHWAEATGKRHIGVHKEQTVIAQEDIFTFTANN